MIRWQDEGLMLGAQLHGETRALATVFTRAHGKITGLVHGGASRKMQATLEPGTSVVANYQARLESDLGRLSLEMARARSHHALASRLGLEGLSAVVALLHASQAEGQAAPALYEHSARLLDLIGFDDGWEALFPLAYLTWEVQLLAACGAALDLSACAVTGRREDLCYLSPKSGRAVSREGAGPWAERLLPLPKVLLGQGEAEPSDIVAALHSTGYFLQEKVFEGADLPAARARFLRVLTRA